MDDEGKNKSKVGYLKYGLQTWRAGERQECIIKFSSTIPTIGMYVF